VSWREKGASIQNPEGERDSLVAPWGADRLQRTQKKKKDLLGLFLPRGYLMQGRPYAAEKEGLSRRTLQGEEDKEERLSRSAPPKRGGSFF